MTEKQHSLTPILDAYLAAWNRHDAKAVADFFDEDGVYIDVALGYEFKNDEITRYVQEMMDFAGLSFKVLGGLAWSENTVAYQEHTYGSAKDGHEVDLYSAEFIEFRGDKIICSRTYYDFSPSHGTKRETTSYKGGISHQGGKYERSGLKGIELASYKQKLLLSMDQEKIYRENNISLKKMAQHLKLSTNHLSQVINSQFGMSFFDFIHRYRINEAVEILQQADNKQTVLDVAESLGFNSTSTFYTSFKKQVGLTPLQYKKQFQR